MAKILIVEDDSSYRKMLSDFLTDKNHHVSTSENGVEGFDKYQQLMPDIVVTDLLMPEEDGLGLLNKLRDDNACKIIAISGGRNPIGPDYLDIAKILGASRIFNKPFELKELNDAINELLTTE